MERYTQVKSLGKGGFAKVDLVVDTCTNKEYAMKIIDISKMMPEKYENEIRLLQSVSRLSHPNIVKYETSFIDTQKHKCYIVMEYCEGKACSYYRERFVSYTPPLQIIRDEYGREYYHRTLYWHAVRTPIHS